MGQTKDQILARSRNDWYLVKLSKIKDCDGISEIIFRDLNTYLLATEVTEDGKVFIKDLDGKIPKELRWLSIYNGNGIMIDVGNITQRWEADFCIKHLIFTGYGWVEGDPDIKNIYIEKA